MMNHEKKLDFVLAMTKHALESVQHFDAGGTVQSSGLGGFLGRFTGTNNNFEGQSTDITPGTDTSQLNTAYEGAQGALGKSSDLAGGLYGGAVQGGGSQNFLTNELTNQIQGNGLTPAQAALNQTTGQNIEQQAAFAASQRGAGRNAGLIASQAARQGAAIQQQAAGQGAILKAAEQQAARNELGRLAAQQIGQAQNAINAENISQQGEQNILQNANTAANQQAVAQQSNINTVNAEISKANQANAQKNVGAFGKVLGGLGSAFIPGGGFLGSLFAEGGKIKPGYEHLHKMVSIYHPHLLERGPQGEYNQVKEGTVYSSQSKKGEPKLAMGGKLSKNMKAGGKVAGKPKVNHDDYGNDTVNAKLTPGEVVMDLDTLHDKGRLGQMARFVAAEIERKKAGRKL